MASIAKGNVSLLQPSFALDVDLIEPVDQDVGDRPIGEERFERTQTEQLVENLDDECLALRIAERCLGLLTLQHSRDQGTQLRLCLLAPYFGEAVQVQLVQQFR